MFWENAEYGFAESAVIYKLNSARFTKVFIYIPALKERHRVFYVPKYVLSQVMIMLW